jgi:type IV secretion system protein TrbL
MAMRGERREQQRFSRLWGHVILVGVVVLTATALAHAQGPTSVNGPSSILDEYKGLQNAWITKLLGAAQRLFFLLAGIEVAWSFTLLAVEKADFQALTATIVRKIMWIGIFYAILLYGVTLGGGGWIPTIIDSFHILGQNASSVGPLGPDAIVGFGVNMAVDLLASLKAANFLTGFATSIALVFCAVVIFIAYLAIAIQFVVALVESYLVIGAGVIFLGFGGSRWTAVYVERYIAYAVSVGMKILVLYLLIGAGMTLSAGWRLVAQNAAASIDPARTGFDLAAAAVMFLCVCWMSPKISSAMLGGVASMSGGDLAGVGMGVGLAAVGAGVVATQYATRGSTAMSGVKEAVAAGLHGPGGGSNGTSGAAPRPGGGAGNGSAPGSPSGGGSSAATQDGMPGGINQPSPPSRPPAAQSAGQQPGPPRTTATSANNSFLSALERTAARVHYAMNSVRIPHDGTSHAPPSSSSGSADS